MSRKRIVEPTDLSLVEFYLKNGSPYPVPPFVGSSFWRGYKPSENANPEALGRYEQLTNAMKYYEGTQPPRSNITHLTRTVLQLLNSSVCRGALHKEFSIGQIVAQTTALALGQTIFDAFNIGKRFGVRDLKRFWQVRIFKSSHWFIEFNRRQ